MMAHKSCAICTSEMAGVRNINLNQLNSIYWYHSNLPQNKHLIFKFLYETYFPI